MQRFSEFVVGLLFGIGLMLSGMTDPGKVVGFLDVFGHWDPSLALVMGGAIAVGVFAFALAKKLFPPFAHIVNIGRCCREHIRGNSRGANGCRAF